MRISDPARGATIAVAGLAAACSPSDRRADGESVARSSPPARAAAGEPRLWCARGAATLARVCTAEEGDDGTLTVRYPDGGFRRLRPVPDGRGVIAADGAEPARVSIVEQGGKAPAAIDLDVQVGPDRVRLPAHLRDRAAPALR